MWLEAGWKASIGKLLPALDRYDIVHVYMTARAFCGCPAMHSHIWLAFFFLSLARYFDDWKRWRRDNAVGGWDGGQVLTNSSLFLTDMIGCQLWWIPNKMISVFSQFLYIYSLLQKFGLTFAFFYWLYTCIYTVSETKGPAVN